MFTRLSAVLSLSCLSVSLCALEAAAPAEPVVPESVAGALDVLSLEARPQVLRRARNGAIYAKLPNGCELIVMEKHSAPVVTVQGWMRTGGVNEINWSGAGLSHFCEHMMFKGTTSRPTGVLDQEIRGAGGDDNAYTNSERTVYHVTCQSSGFGTAFSVLADMLMDSTFPPEETVKEHKVVYKEIERFLDNPDGVLYEIFEQTLYQEHPYRIPVLGYPDRFKRVTRDEVWGYYQERYSPDNCCFVVVGDIDAAKVMPQMASTLATWKRKSIPPTPIAEEPEQLAPRTTTITHPLCQVPNLMLGYPGIPLRHQDLYALDLLASILGDGRSSRLYREVKDKGLVLDISASDYTPMYMGYFVVAATVDGAKLDAARDAILKVLEDAKTRKPTNEEIARARQKMKTARVMGQMNVEGLAGALGSDWFVAGDLDFSDLYVERMQQVTADDLVRVAKQYFLPEKLNVVAMLPKEEAKAKAVVAEKKEAVDAAAALQAEFKSLQADPEVEGANLIVDKGVFEFRLKANGVRVVVREDRSLPLVSMALAALGGTRWEPAELNGAGNLLGEMLDRGTDTRDKLKIAEEAENLGATLGSFAGRSSFGMTASGLKQDAPKLMDLAADCLLHPSFNENELAQLKEDTLQQIAQEDESIITINNKTLRPLLYGNHPYSRQTLGTPETVKKVTAADLKKLHAAWVHPENIAVGFAGDMAVMDALALVKKYFSALKPGELKAPAVPPIAELGRGVTGEAAKEGIKGAILTLAFRGVDLKNSDRETLDMIAELLSGPGGRLSVALREKQGLAYAIRVIDDTQLDGGGIIFFIQTDAKSLNAALEGMWKEAKLLREEPVSGKELNAIKTFMSGSEAIELQNQTDVVQRLTLAQLYGEGAAHVFSRKDRLEKVTPEQIQAAAKKYLDLDHWVKTVLKAKE